MNIVTDVILPLALAFIMFVLGLGLTGGDFLRVIKQPRDVFVVAFSEIMATYAFKKFIKYLVPSEFAPESLVQFLTTEYKFAVSFLILVLVLLVRPT